MDKLKDAMRNALEIAFEATHESFVTFLEKREREAAFNEYVLGLERTVSALADVTNNQETMVAILQRYWGLDYSLAREYVHNELRLNAPCRRLERYLENEKNYSEAEAMRYIRENNVRIILRHEPDLSMRDCEELYLEIERRRK